MGDCRLAVVGVGYWGKNLARNFARLGALSLICDEDRETRERVGAECPAARRSGDYREALDDSSIDGVVLATPAVKHFDHARQALEAGKHVFVEKPLALTEGDGRRLVELAAEQRRILMVGHVLQYHPAVELLAALVRRGDLGTLRYIYSNRLNLGKVRTEENILWSFAPHDISIILGLAGSDPEYVSASGGTYITDGVADVTVSQLAFPNGLRAHIFVSWLHPYKEQRLVVVGERKMAVFDDTAREGKLKLYDKGIDITGRTLVARQTSETTLFFDETEPLYLECREFIRAVRERRPPRTDGCEGLRVLRVLAACQTSLERDGVPVRLLEPQ
jgi:UDP-2-acetamido-3-amino-2,3-dideoxy-glucuronate N-acetyltransferase